MVRILNFDSTDVTIKKTLPLIYILFVQGFMFRMVPYYKLHNRTKA